MIKKLSLILAVCLIITALPIYAAKNEAAVSGDIAKAVMPQNPYGYDTILTQGKDDSYYHVTWTTDIDATHYLQWVESDRVTDGIFPTDCYSATAHRTGIACRARMTDLKSDVGYAYRVGSDLIGWSEIYYTTPKNKDDNKFSFLAVGDPQVLSDVDGENWNTSLEQAKCWFGDDVEFILSLGDQTNAGNTESEFEYFVYPDYLRSTPFISILGNHDDRGSNYSNHFTYTDVDPNTVTTGGAYSGNYWVEYDGMLVIVLNVQYESRATHIAYTGQAIEEYTAIHGEPIWTVVAFHDSLYSSAASRYQDTWSRRDEYSVAFSDMGVDAVFMGHDHIYTRTYMINGTDVNDDAALYTQVGDDPYGSITDPEEGSVLYVTTNSSSGSKFYEMTDRNVPFSACSNQENIPLVTKVDVTPDCMTVYTYRTGPDNEISDLVDFFAIHRTAEEDEYEPILNVPRTTYFYTDDIPDLSEGVSAYDNFDGDISDKITYSDNVDLLAPSVITYTVTDKAGNTETVERVMIPLDEEKLVSTEETVWTYLDDGTWPFEFEDGPDEYRWTTEAFDDSSWKQAVGSFGSINGELAQHRAGIPDNLLELYFPEGSDEEGAIIPNYFFRTTFDVADPGSVSALICNLWFDDAVTIYINGNPVKQYNCFTAGSNMGYSGSQRETQLDVTSQYLSFRIDEKRVLDTLKPEGNILAIELYQGSYTSDDIYFEFEAMRAERSAKKLPFEDVKTSHWYYQSVTRAYNKGLFVGTSDTKFSPNGTMTRAMTWAVLSRIAGEDIGASEGTWYKGYQDWAIASGTSDGKRPNDKVTREQLVSMLYRLSGEPEIEGNLDSFNDKGKVSDWAEKAMIWSVAEGLIVGRNGVLAPRDNATRAEASVLLLKYLEI